jgi:glycerol-3-phosphate acyltransferase PlsY
MNGPVLKILCVIAAYLLGSIPIGYLLVKYIFTEGEDVRKIGSGATGATNVTRRAGLKAGLLTYVLDVAKGSAAVLLMKAVADDNYSWIGAAAIAAIAGHIFPIFLGFRGGKGVATGVGVFIVLAPLSVLSTLVVFALIVWRTRYISLGSIVGTSLVPVWTLLYYGWLFPSPHLTALVVIAIVGCGLIVAKHRENITRLIRGTENKFGRRVATPGAVTSEGKS